MIKLENLRKNYNTGKNEVQVLKGINLEIQKGAITVIFGPSGAGKSTLLHIMGALDRQTSGDVLFEGKNLKDLSERQLSLLRNLRIGFVFQFYHLLPEFDALENVLLPALVKKGFWGLGKIKQKASGLLTEVGLKDKMKNRPSELSGGEQQRVAIARALINSPDLLLCDEPTGNLDSENGLQICALLQKLNRENKTTIVIVTHNQDLAKISHRTVNLKDGVIVN